MFEFADEWWKNYDIPRTPQDYWDRVPAPNKGLTEDMDPEEHYGIVSAYRQPKAAYAVVREMFSTNPSLVDTKSIPFLAVVSLALLAGGLWIWAKRSGRGRSFATPQAGGRIVGLPRESATQRHG